MSKIMSKIIRIITLPTFLTLALIIILWVSSIEAFANTLHLSCSILFLCVFPLLAYPLSYCFHTSDRRQLQRRMAIAFSLVGYIIGFIFGLVSNSTSYEKVLYSTYLLSIILLILSELVFKEKASGHASSTSGPLAMLIYSVSPYYAFGLVILGLVFYCSLQLKRHTLFQLVLGSSFSVLAFIISVLIFA